MLLSSSLSSHYEKFLATGEVKCIDEEIPFEIPDGWEWCRLLDIGKTETGTTPSKSNPEYFGDYIPFLGPANILNSKIINVQQGLSKLGVDYGRIVPKNTILQVCIGGSIGKCAITDKFVSFNQQINSITPYLCNVEFTHIVLQSDYFRLAIMDKATGTATPIINRGNWETLLFPLPPISEQKRIVTKITELMQLLDIYSDKQEELKALNANINRCMKKSILQEAIQGRLVPQDPSDEPASELLKRISEEKLRLVKEGKLKKKEITDSVIFRGDDNRHYEKIGGQIVDISEDIPFDIPDSWSWVRLRNICSIMTGATFKKEDARHDNQGIRVLRGGNILPFEIKSKDDDIFLSPDYIKKDILLKQNDLITPAVTSLENICKMARAEKDMPTTTVGGFVFILRPYYDSDSISTYLLEALSSPALIEFVKSITNKSGQAFYNIGKERLGSALIPLPPIKEQERINDRIELLWNNLR